MVQGPRDAAPSEAARRAAAEGRAPRQPLPTAGSAAVAAPATPRGGYAAAAAAVSGAPAPTAAPAQSGGHRVLLGHVNGNNGAAKRAAGAAMERTHSQPLLGQQQPQGVVDEAAAAAGQPGGGGTAYAGDARPASASHAQRGAPAVAAAHPKAPGACRRCLAGLRFIITPLMAIPVFQQWSTAHNCSWRVTANQHGVHAQGRRARRTATASSSRCAARTARRRRCRTPPLRQMAMQQKRPPLCRSRVCRPPGRVTALALTAPPTTLRYRMQRTAPVMAAPQMPPHRRMQIAAP